MTAGFAVEAFPDVLPLRSADGVPTALFSDHGSWLGVTWGDTAALDVWDLTDGSVHPLDLGSPVARRVGWADRLELTLDDASAWRVGFAPDGLLVVESMGDAGRGAGADGLSIQCPLGVHTFDDAGRLRALVGPGVDSAAAPPLDLFDTNRARWNARFAHAERTLAAGPYTGLAARALTTLFWNTRAPRGAITTAGIIPSPFAYRGYWAWDSWKHAFSLARIAPELALDCLRSQLGRQRTDGMVPDTVFPDPADDNWQNTKPPMAARALRRIVEHTGDAAPAAELFAACARQIDWFASSRRLPDEVLFRAGGVDATTAAWDTGWDDCARFTGVPLVPHGEWRLLDLWQPDYNAYCLEEYRALASLAPLADADRAPWARKADELSEALAQTLWDAQSSCFCDLRPSTGRSTGIRSAATWLPLRAGAATPAQVSAVLALLRDQSAFDTPLPFPVLAASEEAFDPNGYWNGSVWLDHAAAAIEVGGEDGSAARARLLDGVARHGVLYECYSPLTGEPAAGSRPAVPQFSWTAAGVLDLLTADGVRGGS